MTEDIRLSFVGRKLVNPEPGPVPGFEIDGELRNDSSSGVVVLSVGFSIKFDNPPVRIQSNRLIDVWAGNTLGARESQRVAVPVDLSLATLAWIERNRKPDGKVVFPLQMSAVVVSLPTDTSPRPQPRRVHVESRSADGTHGSFAVSRDDWLTFLRGIGFNDMEVFELPAPLILGTESAQGRAIAALNGMQTAIRTQDWDTVFAKARAAMEALATGIAEDGDMKRAFEDVLGRALPGDEHQAKRERVDALARSLGALQHLGRHDRHPFVNVGRADALLAARTTLAFLDYLTANLRAR
jgi:hypothetical protein